MSLKKLITLAAVVSQIYFPQKAMADVNSAYSMVKERSATGPKIFNTVVYVGLSGAGVSIFRFATGFGDENVSAAIVQKIGQGVGATLVAVGVVGLVLTWTDFADAGTIEDHYAQHLDEFLKLPEEQALRMLNSREGSNLRKAIFGAQQAIIETEGNFAQ